MQDYFIFLYPIEEYFYWDLFQKKVFYSTKKKIVERFNEIINTRYRKKGYQVIWLLQEEGYSTGNRSLMDVQCLRKCEDDLLLSAGIFFDGPVEGNVYADPSDVFSQLPASPRKVVLGGFHAYDCVDKIARFAYNNLTKETMVDIDLTELTNIGSGSWAPKVPNIRTEFDLRSYHGKNLQDWFVASMMGIFKEKPWFVQRAM